MRRVGDDSSHGLDGSPTPEQSAQSVLAQRALGARAKPVGVGAWRRGPLLTHLITGVLTWENRALLAAARQGLSLPGLSAWVLCTSPPSSCPT